MTLQIWSTLFTFMNFIEQQHINKYNSTYNLLCKYENITKAVLISLINRNKKSCFRTGLNLLFFFILGNWGETQI